MEILYMIYRLFFAWPFFRRFNYAVYRLGLSGLGILNYKNERISGERYLIKTFLRRYIKKINPVFFDVGANVGNYSKMLLQYFPQATLFAFEPHPLNYKKLEKKIASVNAHLYNTAVGNVSGEITLYDIDESEGSSHATIYLDVIEQIHKKPLVALSVPMTTLDEIAKNENVEFIDYLKIDTEGNDLSVLKGASMLLQNKKVGFIHFEFNEMNAISMVFLRDFRLLLKEYTLFRLLPHGLLPIGDDITQSEIFAFQNILAIPKIYR